MRNQSKNRTRKEYRRVMGENRRLVRQLAVAEEDHFVFPDYDCTPKKYLDARDFLLILFILSVVVAVVFR